MALEIAFPEKSISVRVAVRIRPQTARELIDMCRKCTTVTPQEPQIVLGVDKTFTFDYVFDVNSAQNEIYSTCVERLVEDAFRGYNATILAYGQTGSGKTYTMGTGFGRDITESQEGIIVRAVNGIFSRIETIKKGKNEDSAFVRNVEFSVGVQFMELYKEDIVDLLNPYNTEKFSNIHEDYNGQITVTGLTVKTIKTSKEALSWLQEGVLARTTASTQMNDQSSRSHAIFTILIKQQRFLVPDESQICNGDLQTLTSKLHFVDLAGSERLKRTGATGDRAREGIAINCGLLALGNVISALGDRSKKCTHIPYRDSKLTRLLQDSLGGNSQTLMVACISPTDRDFMETLNTLKYANRARNIENKIQINQDQNSQIICQLRREIAALQLENLEYKQGKRLIGFEGNSIISDTCNENNLLIADNKRLQERVKAMQETISYLITRNSQLELEKVSNDWSISVDLGPSISSKLADYIYEIERLQAKHLEAEEIIFQMKKSISRFEDFQRIDFDNRDLKQLLKEANQNQEENFESTDSDSEEKTSELDSDLNEINCNIEIKKKLIRQLELTQQRMQLMRRQYEEKLSALNNKIVKTQKERDDILVHLGSGNESKTKINKIRDEYERKIKDAQCELKRLQQVQREYIRQSCQLKNQEGRLKKFRCDLIELKSVKSKLIRCIAEQCNKYKSEDLRKVREIALLRKNQRKQQNTVITLQAQMQLKEQILKRKTEEFSALRKSLKNAPSKKMHVRAQLKNIYSFSPRSANKLWNNFSRTISLAVQNKLTTVHLEKDLERLLFERTDITRSIEENDDKHKCSDTLSYEDNLQSNLSFVQNNIEHVQYALMEFESEKEYLNNSSMNFQVFIEKIQNMAQAKFLLQRLSEKAIKTCCDLALAHNHLVEQGTLLKEAHQQNEMQHQILLHLLKENKSMQLLDIFESTNTKSSDMMNKYGDSQKSLNSNCTYDIPLESSFLTLCFHRQDSSIFADNFLNEKKSKIRLRPTDAKDLLFANKQDQNGEN